MLMICLLMKITMESTWPCWRGSTQENPILFGGIRSNLELMFAKYYMVMVPILGT